MMQDIKVETMVLFLLFTFLHQLHVSFYRWSNADKFGRGMATPDRTDAHGKGAGRNGPGEDGPGGGGRDRTGTGTGTPSGAGKEITESRRSMLDEGASTRKRECAEERTRPPSQK